jgi:CBS-domain-containing membrane protein
MNALQKTDPEGERPLVRLRVRRLQRVRSDGGGEATATVFCPGRNRSMDLEACRRCPRIASMSENAIECTPPSSESAVREQLAAARLGGDANVGDAMGQFTLSVHAFLAARDLVRAFERTGGVVAVVVDDAGRLVGLVDAEDAARADEQVRTHELATRVRAVHESAPLFHAIDRMVHERARALPVVDEDGYVVALLTDLDALHWVACRMHRSE